MATIKWSADPAHTEITFKVKHLMITTVTGQFNEYTVDVETEGDDFHNAGKIEFSANINSIDTNNEQRNAHLRSADFFHAEKNPKLYFFALKITQLHQYNRKQPGSDTTVGFYVL